MIRSFLFDATAPVLIDLVDAQPDPDLAARNRARIDAAKAAMGDRYILAKPINPKPADWLNRKEQA